MTSSSSVRDAIYRLSTCYPCVGVAMDRKESTAVVTEEEGEEEEEEEGRRQRCHTVGLIGTTFRPVSDGNLHM